MGNFTLALQYFFIDLVGGILRWPIWWYSKGAVMMAKKSWGLVKGYGRSLALGVWIKNLFVPMFGLYDWKSRIISFFMRVVQIILRFFGVVILSLLTLCFYAAYLLAPPAALIAFIYFLTGDLWI